MTERSPDGSSHTFNDMSLGQIEEIRSGLLQRKGGLVVNQQILFRHAAALPPARRASLMIAGWGPIVIFPLSPILYFVDWKLALFVIFLSIFWLGMGRKYAQAVILAQCREDSAFLKHALTVGLVRLV